MTPWPRHALAVVLLAALNLGLYGRLYSPLDHAYPEGEAASAAVTRFIAENPNPWGWNPIWDAGQPIQMTALPGFHYAAALLAKAGNEPLYAHRVLAVTMALLMPLAVYFLFISFGMPWLVALVAGAGVTTISPLRFSTLLSFLPARLQHLELTGDAPLLASLTLLPVAIALLWRAGLSRLPASSFFAALVIAAIALMHSEATLVLLLAILMFELALLGIAGEYRFSHRRVIFVVVWAYALSCFWLTPQAAPLLMYWSDPVILPRILIGAILIRLMFLGRRNPLACWIALCLWTFGYLSFRSTGQIYLVVAEFFLLLGVFVCVTKCFEEPRVSYRLAGIALMLVLLLVRFDLKPTSWPTDYTMPENARDGLGFYWATPTAIKKEFREWRGDWSLRRPSESDEFKVTRWFVENPPRGRVWISPTAALAYRFNSWVSLPQTGILNSYYYYPRPGLRADNEYAVAIAANLDSFKGNEVVAKFGKYTIYRLPFQSLAVSVKDSESGPPLQFTWAPDRIRVAGDLPHGYAVEVKAHAHEGWIARQGIQQLPIETDSRGAMRLSPPAGPIDIILSYEGTREQHIFGYVSAFAWVASIGYVLFRSRRG